jgi:hypothetical protein
MPTSETIDPLDPIFVSYRQTDGTEVTSELAWLLRSAGIPVWRDRDDLPPGDTEQRLAQAIDEGISGAVIVVTPDIAASRIVREIEAPRLLSLHSTHSEFALGIANGIEREANKLDYEAPDRLLRLSPVVLAGVDQHGTSRKALLETVRKMVFHRIAHCRANVVSDSGTFRISVQTRNTPQVYDRTDSHLDIRVRPSNHERLPSSVGLLDLRDTIVLLPDSVTRADARRVLISGGAHTSVAFALGAALPSSRVGETLVIDQKDRIWASGDEADFGTGSHLRMIGEGRNREDISGRPSVVIFLDLIETSSDAAFERFMEESSGAFVTWTHIARATKGLIDPAEAGELASEAAAYIRKVSADSNNAEVHLLLRGPFPVAVLIGRLTNTLRSVVYEWDDSDPLEGDDWRPRYVPTLRLRTSASDGVIQEVM